jgi:hypothetical protein
LIFDVGDFVLEAPVHGEGGGDSEVTSGVGIGAVAGVYFEVEDVWVKGNYYGRFRRRCGRSILLGTLGCCPGSGCSKEFWYSFG